MTNSQKLQSIITKLEVVADVRSDYSGRGMFGETCVGIVCTHEAEPYILIEAVKMGFPIPKIDSMGKGLILYWPDRK